MLDPQQTVADLVLNHSECASIFRRHRIDFCCRGDLSIQAACEDRGVDSQALIDELSQAITDRHGHRGLDPRALSTVDLIERIVSKHHGYLREVLPFVQALAAKVSRVHGDHNPRLRELETVVNTLVGELEPHLDNEEQVLFPLLTTKGVDNASVIRELEAMNKEHLGVGELLESLRTATEDFYTPDWACNSYRGLFSELEQLEADVLEHVHLENHVLMPRFIPRQ